MERFVKFIIRIIGWINICFILLLTVVTLVDVFARYFFDTSFLDAIIISSYLLAMINSLALSGTTLRNGHVQVDLLYEHLPEDIRFCLDLFNNFLAATLFFCMSWYDFVRAAESWHRGFSQGWMQLPEYPAKFSFAFGCLITALTFLMLFLESLSAKEKSDHIREEPFTEAVDG